MAFLGALWAKVSGAAIWLAVAALGLLGLLFGARKAGKDAAVAAQAKEANDAQRKMSEADPNPRAGDAGRSLHNHDF